NEVSTTPQPPALTITSISSSANSPQPLGTTVTFAAAATGGVTPYQFKWWVSDGTTSVVGKDWAANNSFGWTPTAANSNYNITVWGRNATSSADAPESPSAVLTTTFAISGSNPPPPSTVKLAWDPNTESDLAGYIVSYGTTSGQYSSSVDVGNITTYNFSPSDPNLKYYI